MICIKTTIFLYDDDDATQRQTERKDLSININLISFFCFFTKFFHFLIFILCHLSSLLFKYDATNISIVDLLVLIGGRKFYLVVHFDILHLILLSMLWRCKKSFQKHKTAAVQSGLVWHLNLAI